MAVRKVYATMTENGMKDATGKLDDWMTRGLSDAVKKGLDEYGFKLLLASYENMKLPTRNAKGRRDPWYVGLRWRRTKQLHSPPARTGNAAEWQIKVQPQYLAMWQEVGTDPHTVFNPDRERGKAFLRISAKQNRRREKITNLKNTQNRDAKQNKQLRRAEQDERRMGRQLESLRNMQGTYAVMGYSDESKIPKKNIGSDWLRRGTPKEEFGRRAGQPRPTAVPSGRAISTRFGQRATRPIARGAERISGMHRQRMAELLADAYRRRGR